MVMRYCMEYVNHMLRFYCRYSEKDWVFKNEIEERNWCIVKEVLDGLSGEDKNAIINLYRRNGKLVNNILEVCKDFKIPQRTLWTILTRVSKEIARKKELL